MTLVWIAGLLMVCSVLGSGLRFADEPDESSDDTGGESTGLSDMSDDAGVEDSPPDVSDDTGVDETSTSDDAGSDDSPAEISDEVRRISRGQFSDDQLRAFGDDPERVAAATQAVYQRLLDLGANDYTSSPQDQQQPRQQANNQESVQEKVVSEFKANLDTDKFEDSPVEAVTEALQGVSDYTSKQISQLAKTVEQLVGAMQNQGQSAQKEYASKLVSSTERIRKELGDEYADLFGHQPVSVLARNPNSSTFKRVNKLVMMMENIDRQTGGGGPETWDAEFAMNVMAASRDEELMSAYKKAQRKGFQKAVNKSARGAVRGGTSRKKERELTPEQAKAEAKRDARKIVERALQGQGSE